MFENAGRSSIFGTPSGIKCLQFSVQLKVGISEDFFQTNQGGISNGRQDTPVHGFRHIQSFVASYICVGMNRMVHNLIVHMNRYGGSIRRPELLTGLYEAFFAFTHNCEGEPTAAACC